MPIVIPGRSPPSGCAQRVPQRICQAPLAVNAALRLSPPMPVPQHEATAAMCSTDARRECAARRKGSAVGERTAGRAATATGDEPVVLTVFPLSARAFACRPATAVAAIAWTAVAVTRAAAAPFVVEAVWVEVGVGSGVGVDGEPPAAEPQPASSAAISSTRPGICRIRLSFRTSSPDQWCYLTGPADTAQPRYGVRRRDAVRFKAGSVRAATIGVAMSRGLLPLAATRSRGDEEDPDVPQHVASE